MAGAIRAIRDIDNDILLNPSVSIEAKATLALLKYFDRGNGRGCFARKETLCRFLAISPYRLRKALQELQTLKLITIQRKGQGQPDVIRVVQRERQQGPKGPKGLLQVQTEEGDEIEIDQIEEGEEGIDQINEGEFGIEEELPDGVGQGTEELGHVDEELQEELGQVVEELPDVAPADLQEPLKEPAVLEVNEVEIQKSNFLSIEHYIEEKNKDKNIIINTPCTIPDSTWGTTKTTKNQCEELIKYFYETKEHRPPTHNEIINWTPTARRLLSEFSLDELKPATQNAIAQGARLFYFVALTAPGYIIGQRQQREAKFHSEKVEKKVREEKEGRNRRLEEIKASATVYACETANLLENLSQHMRPQTFRAFFLDTFISASDEGSITLIAPSLLIAQWIEEHYGELLKEIAGKEVRIVTVTA